MTNTTGWVASTTGIYLLTVLEAEVQEQGVSRLGFFCSLLPWLADGSSH